MAQQYNALGRLHIYRLNEEEDRLEKDAELRRRAAVAAGVQAAERARIAEEDRAAVHATELEQLRHEQTVCRRTNPRPAYQSSLSGTSHWRGCVLLCSDGANPCGSRGPG